MRKGMNKFRKLSRTPSHKWALLRNMVTSLIVHERIVTTTPKAKELRRLAEKLVTTAQKGLYTPKPTKQDTAALHARRLINTIVQTPAAQTKLMNVLAPRYQFREGGYTRIMKLSARRKGDNADMSVMEFVDRPGEIRAARPPTAFQQRMDELPAILQELGVELQKDAAAAHQESVPQLPQ